MRRFPEAMPCLYTTKKDLSDRLDGTLCRYDDKLVFVRVLGEYDEEEGPVNYLQLYDWPDSDKKFKKIKPDDPKFDISLLDVGYMNYYVEEKNYVQYFSRSTSKKYKQGTNSNYLTVQGIDGGPSVAGAYIWQTPGFVDMINGKYPGIEPLLKGQINEVALSSDLAVRRDSLGVLEYFWRCTKIAVKIPGNKIHKLDSEYSWLVDKILGAHNAID